MQQVETDDEGGLDEPNTKAMLTNLLLYKGALDKCNNTILIYNKGAK